MDYKLLDKLKALLFFLSGNYLVFAGIYAKGHPVVAGIVAILLLFISLAFVIFDRDYFPGLDLPDDICNLAVDTLLIVIAILYFCFDEEETGVTFMPIIILGVGAAALDIVRLVGTGAFKNKSFKEIFNEQLHLPLFLDVVLLFWPLYHGFTEGWDSVHTIEFVGIGFFAFDLIHNLIILPGRIPQTEADCPRIPPTTGEREGIPRQRQYRRGRLGRRDEAAGHRPHRPHRQHPDRQDGRECRLQPEGEQRD